MQTDTASGLRFVAGAACLVVIIAGLKSAEALLVPLVFSAFLAIMSAPVVFWLRRRVPDVVAVLVVVVGVLVMLLALAGVVGGSVNTFVTAAPGYQERLETLRVDSLFWLESRGLHVDAKKLGSMVNASAAISLLGGTVSQLASMLSDTLLVILTLVFILFEATVFPAKVRTAFGDTHAKLDGFAIIVEEVHQYVVIKTYLSLGTGAIVWLLCWLLGIDFSLLWGLLAFLLNYVPNIGAIIAGIPPVLLALLQYGPGRATIALVGFLSIHLFIGNLLEPRVMGRRLGLSTLVVFLSLIFWGWLWGAMGMLLSVPLTMLLKILFENTKELRWIAVLMDGELPAGASAITLPTPSRPPGPLSLRPPPSGPLSSRTTPLSTPPPAPAPKPE